MSSIQNTNHESIRMQLGLNEVGAVTGSNQKPSNPGSKIATSSPANSNPVLSHSVPVLDGTKSTPSLKGTKIVTYLWKQLSGPTATKLATPNQSRTKVYGLEAGTYEFELTITDDSGNTAATNVALNVE